MLWCISQRWAVLLALILYVSDLANFLVFPMLMGFSFHCVVCLQVFPILMGHSFSCVVCLNVAQPTYALAYCILTGSSCCCVVCYRGSLYALVYLILMNCSRLLCCDIYIGLVTFAN
jgi:hypothetical protein